MATWWGFTGVLASLSKASLLSTMDRVILAYQAWSFYFLPSLPALGNTQLLNFCQLRVSSGGLLESTFLCVLVRRTPPLFLAFNSWVEDVLRTWSLQLPPTQASNLARRHKCLTSEDGELRIHGFVLPTMLTLWPDHVHQFSADGTALGLGDLLVQQNLMEPRGGIAI